MLRSRFVLLILMETDSSGFGLVGRSTLTTVAADRGLYNDAFLCGDTVFIRCGRQPRGFMRFDSNIVLRTDEARISVSGVRTYAFGCEALGILHRFVCCVSFAAI